MINHIAHPTWTRDAACRTLPTALFFPPAGRSAAAAKAVCADCPVVQPCAQMALDDHGLHGVFGGLTVGERDRIRQHRNAA